jgi:Flp pilus assembly protein TadG
MFARRLRSDEDGATVVELAFALPIFIVMVYMIVQLGEVYFAVAGMQQALGQGARYATLCVSPTISGCSAPTAAQIKTAVQNSVFGTGTGQFTVEDPVSGSSGTAKYYDLTVDYTQSTSLLLLPGPTISVSRSKRVWIAG